MINLIINEDDRATGYSNVDYSTSDEVSVVETSKEELSSLVEGVKGDYKENIRKFKIDNNDNIIFEKDYEPPKPTGGN